MINFIKNLFSSKETFEVIHYPVSGKYFPMVNKKFLYRQHSSGMVVYNTKWMGTLYAENFYCEKDAWECIDQWREHNTGFKVEVLTRD